MFTLGSMESSIFLLRLHKVVMYTFRCAERMGHEKLIAEARRLEMDQKPSLDLPSLRDAPIVPDPIWKKKISV